MLKISDINSDLLKMRLSRTLRRFIGPRMRYSYDEASEMLATDRRTVEGWVRGERCPNMEGFMRLASLPEVGPVIANEIFTLISLQICETLPEDASAHEVSSWLGGALQNLLHKLEDGRLDHVEEAEYIPVALSLSQRLTAWAQARLERRAAE